MLSVFVRREVDGTIHGACNIDQPRVGLAGSSVAHSYSHTSYCAILRCKIEVEGELYLRGAPLPP